MTSAFHRRRSDPAPGFEAGQHRRITWRLHPVLTGVLNALEGAPIGQAFKDRAVEVAMSNVFSDPIDFRSALAAHRWVLERADGDGLQLTAAGYLKPADVKALAAVMPTMHDWIFPVSREIDAHPVRYFREHLKSAGLLRKYKGTLRLTRAGREGLDDPPVLWTRLADALIPAESGFDAEASVVILVHAATVEDAIDIGAIARTLTALGWSRSDGSAVGHGEVYGVWNDLWAAVGNVGERAGGRRSDRSLSAAARILIHDALFDESISEPTR